MRIISFVKKEIRRLLSDYQYLNPYQGMIVTFDEEEQFESKEKIQLKTCFILSFFTFTICGTILSLLIPGTELISIKKGIPPSFII